MYQCLFPTKLQAHKFHENELQRSECFKHNEGALAPALIFTKNVLLHTSNCKHIYYTYVFAFIYFSQINVNDTIPFVAL